MAAVDEFVAAAWNDHAERSEEVADRIGASFGLIESSDHVPFFVQLLVHVYGEHLGRWQRGAGGDGHALDALSAEDRLRALASAASALAGRGDLARAVASFREALRRGEAGLSAGSPAIRALAAAGNNLAVALESKNDRSTEETDAMVEAAQAALTCWKQAGTWVEEERAEYRLARSLLQAGEPAAALQCAGRCLQVCEQHDAPAFERFFAHAVLAFTHRAAGEGAASQAHRKEAMVQLERVPAEERQPCQSDLEELGR